LPARTNTAIAVELHPSREFIVTAGEETQQPSSPHVADVIDREAFVPFANAQLRATQQTASGVHGDLFTILQSAAAPAEAFDIGRELAALLDDEADLRGIDR
jgi:hypothetical protein